MKSAVVLTTSVLCLVTAFIPSVVAGAAGAPRQKIDLKILYAGKPGSPRTADFRGFLREHFANVETTDLAKFSAKQARKFDVVLLDYDEDSKSPSLRFANDYMVPTVTVGSVGAKIAFHNGLKTGYE
jgi:hypothetical protein